MEQEPTGSRARWLLENAEDRHGEAPRSFFIPPRDRRTSLARGDIVKLLFLLESDERDETGHFVWHGERMWVLVTEVDGERYLGRLENTPHTSDALSEGELVVFGPEHVAAELEDPQELGYDLELLVVLNRRIRDEDLRPDSLFLAPSVDSRDSGWEAHLDDEAGELGPEDVGSWPLGYLTDRFPETAAPLREAKLGWWRWDPERGVYVHLCDLPVR